MKLVEASSSGKNAKNDHSLCVSSCEHANYLLATVVHLHNFNQVSASAHLVAHSVWIIKRWRLTKCIESRYCSYHRYRNGATHIVMKFFIIHVHFCSQSPGITCQFEVLSWYQSKQPKLDRPKREGSVRVYRELLQ